MNTLTIIIVSYNTKFMLQACLTSIQETSKDEVSVFVVDNASSDGSANMVASEFPEIILIRNQKNLGFAEANNQAIKKSDSAFVMLLNADTVMLPGTVQKVIKFMEDTPSAGVVGCKLLNTDRSLQPSVTSFPGVIKDTAAIALKGSILSNNPASRKWMSRLSKLLGFNASRFDDHSSIKEIGFPRGACLTIRQEAFQKVGLLDPEYFFTGEEMDLCYRIRQHGWKILYYPDAAVIHHDHGSSSHMMGKVFVQTRKSALRFYQKHYGTKRTEMMKFCVSSVLLMKIVFNGLRIPFVKTKRHDLLCANESYWAIIRVHYDQKFCKLNVFSEMPFRYN